MSIARTIGVTVVALSSGVRLGVDVERLDRFTDRCVADVVLHRGESATTSHDLATTWVRKEALLKACGDGLSVDPASVRLRDTDGSPVIVDWPDRSPRPDWLIDLELAPDLSAAVAGSGIVRAGDLSVWQAGPGGLLG